MKPEHVGTTITNLLSDRLGPVPKAEVDCLPKEFNVFSKIVKLLRVDFLSSQKLLAAMFSQKKSIMQALAASVLIGILF